MKLEQGEVQVAERQTEPGITLDRVYFSYDPQQALLRGLTWELERGRSAVLSGGNGCGKSSLLYVCAGLLSPQKGAVLLAGHPIYKLLPSERFRRGLRIGFVFQEGGLLANLSARANVALALHYHRDVLGLTEEQIEARVDECLELAQMTRADHSRLPAHLSFGHRKRLALARAIALQPSFFFFDDPDVGLDQRTALLIHELLCKLRDDPETTLLVATNRAQLMERLEIPAFRLTDGRLSSRAPGSSLLPQPESWDPVLGSLRLHR